MAHVGAERNAFVAAEECGIPVVAFTTTRSMFLQPAPFTSLLLAFGSFFLAQTFLIYRSWNSLQRGHDDWVAVPPTTADCVSFAMSALAVQTVLISLVSKAEVTEVHVPAPLTAPHSTFGAPSRFDVGATRVRSRLVDR